MAWVREEAFETGFACRGETVIVRVTRAGTLEMEGYDLEYDQASMEFYGDRTPCYEMYKKWDDNPSFIIVDYFSMPYFVLFKLAIDWAEHVSWMIPRPSHLTPRMARMFDEAKEYVNLAESIFINNIQPDDIPRKDADKLISLGNNFKLGKCFESSFCILLTTNIQKTPRACEGATGNR